MAARPFALLSLQAFPGADRSRIAAGVVSGLGFLGAGMILKDADARVHGLTTAAGIWVVGAIGLAIGAGMYLYGLVCAAITALVLLSERFLRLGERLGRRPDRQSDG